MHFIFFALALLLVGLSNASSWNEGLGARLEDTSNVVYGGAKKRMDNPEGGSHQQAEESHQGDDLEDRSRYSGAGRRGGGVER